jgi:hypothetical protein
MQSSLRLSRLVFSTRHPLALVVQLIKALIELFQSMEHRWIVRHWKADFSPMCISACCIQQWNPGTSIFSNGWVIYHWILNVQDFPYPLHIWNWKWNWRWWNFLSGLVCLITRWMEHIMCQTRRSSVNNSVRDPLTSHTDGWTEEVLARHKFI